MAQVSEQLIGDHAALDKVLKQLQTALRSSDLELAHTKLDLFWAKLAVHIRAEHLHLFPTVLSSLETAAVIHASAPSLEEAQSAVAQLREDHDFFMNQLAVAIEIVRELLRLSDPLINSEGLNNLQKIVSEVQERVVKHNELEETQIYHWATILLNSEEQAKLANQITAQLSKHPPRFTQSTWFDAKRAKDD